MLQRVFYLLVIFLLPISTVVFSQPLLRSGVNGWECGDSFGLQDTINTGMRIEEGPSDSVQFFSSYGWPTLNGLELCLINSFGKINIQEQEWPDSVFLDVNVQDTLNMWLLGMIIVLVDTTGEGVATFICHSIPMEYGWQTVPFWVGLKNKKINLIRIQIYSFARNNSKTGVAFQANNLVFKKNGEAPILVDPFQYIWPTTAVEPIQDLIPSGFVLEQNYPNPFNPNTKIRYELPETSPVRLTVYNLLGEKVANLVDEEQSLGVYEVDFNGSNLSSGTYIYVLQTNNYRLQRKMTVLK